MVSTHLWANDRKRSGVRVVRDGACKPNRELAVGQIRAMVLSEQSTTTTTNPIIVNRNKNQVTHLWQSAKVGPAASLFKEEKGPGQEKQKACTAPPWRKRSGAQPRLRESVHSIKSRTPELALLIPSHLTMQHFSQSLWFSLQKSQFDFQQQKRETSIVARRKPSRRPLRPNLLFLSDIIQYDIPSP